VEEKAGAIASQRVDALDALRGLAILAMVFSSTIRYKILPAWMYHAQVPPPAHEFNKTLAGLTWVDIVFPLFLFAMGAAIPFALSRRIAQGWTTPRIIIYILKRGALLGAFAIILHHLRPANLDPDPSRRTWILAMVGFGLLCLMFGRLPLARKLERYRLLITLLGWVAGVALVLQFSHGGQGLLLDRSDPILISLANMAVFGSLLWLFTRSNVTLRLGILVMLLALQFASGSEGWVQQLWRVSPAPWIFQFYYLKYLFIVIPGTIAGDLSLNTPPQVLVGPEITEPTPLSPDSQHRWSHPQLALIIGSMLTICGVLLIGLQARWLWQTTLLVAILCWASNFVVTKSDHPVEQRIRQYYQWGMYWLALGLAFEPFQAGIKKDPSTYSYYFVTAAIASFLLIVFTLLIDRLHQQKRLQLLIENGQNPMIAYVAFANLLWPLLQLSGLEDWIIAQTSTPILGVLKGVIYTLLVALLTSFCTRQKFFWKT
jgi:predicted acyltransferase